MLLRGRRPLRRLKCPSCGDLMAEPVKYSTVDMVDAGRMHVCRCGCRVDEPSRKWLDTHPIPIQEAS